MVHPKSNFTSNHAVHSCQRRSVLQLFLCSLKFSPVLAKDDLQNSILILISVELGVDLTVAFDVQQVWVELRAPEDFLS